MDADGGLGRRVRTRTEPNRPRRTLLVCSAGGHLDEMYRLSSRFGIDPAEIDWATFESDQARTLLADQSVHFIPWVHPKDARGTAANTHVARRLLASGTYARVISTGAAVAVPFIAMARRFGIAAHYIESAARSQGPSLTGRLVATIPRVRLYGQYPSWTAGRWQYRGSVFDGFEARRLTGTLSSVSRAVVTFGTQRNFGFRAAAERLVDLIPGVCGPDASVLWQTGATPMDGLKVDSNQTVPLRELTEAVKQADLIVAHAGVGSALLALEQNQCPVLIPRTRSRNEHTDDHQALVADELERRGLAVRAKIDTLTHSHLLDAASRSVRAAASPPEFVLQPD